MTRYFLTISVYAVSAIALVTVATPTLANDKAYSEGMLRSLVEMCVKENPKGILVPFAIVGTSQKTLPTIIGEYQAIVTDSINASKQTRLEQEQAIDVTIAQRLVQLKEKLKDQKALKQELTKVREVIAIGSVNGEKITVEQLKLLTASANDLEQLSKDPKYVEVMAQTAKSQLLATVRSRDTQFKQEANNGLLKLKRCECAIDRIQKRYSVNELGDRIKLEITASSGISTDMREAFAQCPKP